MAQAGDSPTERLHRAAATLREFRNSFASPPAGEIVGRRFEILASEIRNIQQQLPGILPEFDPEELKGRWAGWQDRYEAGRIQLWLSAALAQVEAASAVKPAQAGAEDFSFIQDSGLRKIVERDYAEIGRAVEAECWKSTLVLCGAVIEAILLDLLLQTPGAADANPKLSREKLKTWVFFDLIQAALKLGLVSNAIERLSDAVRQYRNVVHPGKELKEHIRFEAEEARIAYEVLKIIRRDLSGRQP